MASHDELRRLRAAGLPAAECGVIARHVQRAVEIALHDGPDDGAGVFGWDAESGAMAWSVVTKHWRTHGTRHATAAVGWCYNRCYKRRRAVSGGAEESSTRDGCGWR